MNFIFSLLMSLFLLSGGSRAEIPFELPSRHKLAKLRTAKIYTEYGEIDLQLFPQAAPWHVANFKYLADKGFYRGSHFHIYKKGYILQGGDPTGSGTGGPGYSLPPEFNSYRHLRGAVGMARVGNASNPSRRSHGSQFYIILGNAPHMDGQYTIFGKVVHGMDIVDRLRKGDLILDIKVFVRPE